MPSPAQESGSKESRRWTGEDENDDQWLEALEKGGDGISGVDGGDMDVDCILKTLVEPSSSLQSTKPTDLVGVLMQRPM